MSRRENIRLSPVHRLPSSWDTPHPMTNFGLPEEGGSAPQGERPAVAASRGGTGWMGCTAEIPQLDRTLNRCVSQIRSQIRLVWLPCQPWDRCSQRQHWTGLKPKLAHRTVLSAWLRKAGLGRWMYLVGLLRSPRTGLMLSMESFRLPSLPWES